ncbi:hybrid sensor histidine kinase/response regulator [Horticoccus sp. 23ND18S-11]|uniref:hybrid sensor histidine kinase/response regulator n=1 Tax=Horticoccus sp. 23ND18S-11 TaxID=3391832 RepID=UPI0039C9F181
MKRRSPARPLKPAWVQSFLALGSGRSHLPRALVLIPLGLWSAGIAHAGPDGESGRPFLQTFTPRDYRAHQQVWMGAQGPDGLMWFGNSHSVISYDGAAWRRINIPGTSWIRTLAFGQDQRLYVGGTDQLGFIAPGPDGAPRFTSLLEKLPTAHRSSGVIWSMAAARDAVWFATESLVLRWQRGEFRAWSFTNHSRQYLQRVGDELFLHRQGVGLFQFAGDDFSRVTDSPEVAGSQFCLVERLEDGSLLLGLGTGPFFRWQDGKLTRYPTPTDALFARTKLRYMVRLPDGTRAIGTTTLGVIVTDADFNFRTRLSATNGLESEQLLSLTPDRERGVWIGTGNGVVRAEIGSRFSVFDKQSGLPRNLTHDLRRHAGTFYAATAEGLLRLVPADTATGTPARFEPVPGVRDPCWSLASHPAGLLIATGRGVLQLPPDGTAPRLIFEAPDGVSKLTALRGQPDRMFVGRFIGLNVLRFADGRWRDEGGVPGLKTEIRTVAEAADGVVWLGTPTRGFIKVVRPPGSRADDWSRATFSSYREDHGLPTEQGWSHVYAPGDRVVFVTDSGTFTYDATADQFRVDPDLQIAGRHVRTQLWPLTPTAIPDVLWAQADTENTDIPRQLGRLTRQPGRAAEFSPLPRKILEQVAFGGARTLAWERADDREYLWLGGPDALVRTDLGAAPPPAATWNVLIRDVVLPDGTRLTPTAGAAAPRFAYARAPLTLAYSAPRFGAGPVMRYQTRLIGYDDAWQPWSPRTEAEFTNLSGGPFTFEVRAQDPDGNMSAPARFTFSVAPPWHQSLGAYILYGLVIAGGLFAFVHWRLGQGERERARLEALVATRTGELATARDAAEAANRAKSAFLAAMSHELRTPLNGVIGYSQILQNDARLLPDQKERLGIVLHSGEHLLRMINDVLDLAKIEAGRIELRLAPFAPGELLRDIAASHTSTATSKGLAFTLELPAELPPHAIGDAQKLRQVLDNLIGNAIKFTPRGSVIVRVTLLNAGEAPSAPDLTAAAGMDSRGVVTPPAVECAFSVTDTGPGISTGDQARLFQPFEQAEASRGDAPGTGLGLAISRALVERMGGALVLSSEPGRGSTFTFNLVLQPVSAVPATAAALNHIIGYEGVRRRVLVVDDHAINRRLVADLLVPLGFNCTAAESAQTALAGLTSGGEPWPDLVVLDVRMAGLDGLALTRRLRAHPRGRDLKVLLMSASVLSFDVAEGHRAGADDFLAKPFRAPELLEKVGHLLQLQWATLSATADESSRFAAETDVPLPAGGLAQLRDALAQGDLADFRCQLAVLRAAHPAAERRWRMLDEAAAAFQLSRLRQLLESP